MPTVENVIQAFGTSDADDQLCQFLNDAGYTDDLDAMDPRGYQLIRGSGGLIEGEYVDPREWSDEGDKITAVVTLQWTESQHGHVTNHGSMDRQISIDKEFGDVEFTEYLGSGIEPEPDLTDEFSSSDGTIQPRQ